MRSISVLAAVTAIATATVTSVVAEEPGASIDWSGFYAGIGITGHSASGLADVSQNEQIDYQDRPAPDGAGVGGLLTLGYRTQHGTVLFGIDGQFDIGGPFELGGGDDYYHLIDEFCPADGLCANSGVKGTLDPLWRLRGTLGAELTDGVVFYGAGGIAAADASIAGIFAAARDINGGFESQEFIYPYGPYEQRLIGPSVGAGFEARLTGNLSIRAEASIDWFGDVEIDGIASPSASRNGGGTTVYGSFDADEYVTLINKSAQVSLIWDLDG